MLIENGSHLYSYIITRDYGFAPNPFHGFCTLATCKPDIRSAAKIGDWILGIGGKNIKFASHKCIFIMKVSDKISFQQYWSEPSYSIKKSMRNGSLVRAVGDNIYHRDNFGKWIQEDSHHSNPDGSTNFNNLKRDTKRTDNVLISDLFLYFGSTPVEIDIVSSLGKCPKRKHKKNSLTDSNSAGKFVVSLIEKHRSHLNTVFSDPCHFKDSHQRVDQKTGKIFL